jgi:hypothetical protein
MREKHSPLFAAHSIILSTVVIKMDPSDIIACDLQHCHEHTYLDLLVSVGELKKKKDRFEN